MGLPCTMFVVICPHCTEPILIEALNCGIFRHGVYIASGEQMDPHASKEVCDALVADKKIYGCGKPFRVANDTLEATMCDYI